MTTAPDIVELLACPRSDGELTRQEGSFFCSASQTEYPVIGGLPVLFAEPAAALAEWRGRINSELSRLKSQAMQLERSLTKDDLADQTRARLTGLLEAHTDQQERLRALLQDFLGGSPPASRPTYLALRTRLPSDQGVNTYYQNLHRDWAWDTDENTQALELVAGELPDSFERLLVLGAGAGRLAYDLHHLRRPAVTVALDFNPLLLTVGQKLSAGETVRLWEFPLAPRSAEEQACLNEMSVEAASPGLHFVLADALRPPFAPGSFDVVVTPWLVDIVPAELGEFAARINRLLTNGGRWVNFGSLSFSHAEPAHNYTRDECPDVVQTQGFANFQSREDDIPYMGSPLSRHRRVERVLTWSAEKIGNAPSLRRHRALPDWLVTGKDPVPATQSFQYQAASARIHSFVMGLIDGKRSIRDMAKHMEAQRLMEATEAEGVIRQFFTAMYDESQRG